MLGLVDLEVVTTQKCLFLSFCAFESNFTGQEARVSQR